MWNTLYTDIFCQVKAIFSNIIYIYICTYAKVFVQVNQVIKTTKEFLIFCTENVRKNVDIIFVSIYS